jgi:hypothetical protein
LLGLPGRTALKAYVTSTATAGVVAIALAAAFGAGTGDMALIAGLVVAGAASERWKVGLFGDAHVSLAAVAMMVAALAGGARDAVIVAPLVAVAVNFGGVVPLYKTAFNIAAYALATLAFLGTVRLCALTPIGDGWPEMVIAATFGATAYFAVNTAMVAFAVALAAGGRATAVIRERYLWLLPHYVLMGAVAAMMAHAYAPAGAWVIAVFAVPVAATQVALHQYSTLKQQLNAARAQGVEERLKDVEAELALARRLDRTSTHVA